MLSKKILVTLLALVMIVSLFGACGDSGSGDSTTDGTETADTGNDDGDGEGSTIEMDTGADETATKMEMWTFVDLHGELYADMAQRWNAENPDRQIDIEMIVLAYDDMHNKLTMALQSGEGVPDMVDIEIGKFPSYLQGEVQFFDLTSYVDPYRDDIVASRLEIYGKDGKNYGVPTHVGATVAFYNTEILEAAGVDYTTIVTWDDYRAAGEKVRDAGYAMGVSETNNTAVYDMMMVAQGSDKTLEDGTPNLDSAESIKALTLIQDLYNEGIDKTIAGGHPDTEEARGEIPNDFACIIRPLWFMSRYTGYLPEMEGVVALAPAPVFEAGQTRSFGGGGTGTVVYKDAVDPDLAAEYLCYAKLSVTGNEQIWNVLGFDPCNTSLWEDESLTHNPDNQFVKFFVTNPFDVLHEIEDEIGLVRSNIGVVTVNNVLNTVTLPDIIMNNVDPAQAAADAQAQALNEMG